MVTRPNQKNLVKFRFSGRQISAMGLNARAWGIGVRQEEIKMVLSALPHAKFNKGFEIGAGDGVQSSTLAKHCSKLICSEIGTDGQAYAGGFKDWGLNNVNYIRCDAEDLTRFSDNEFDLVYSSNVLEHIVDIDQAIRECTRVLTRSGIAIHVMPSRSWKVGNFIFGSLSRRKIAEIHGQSTSHLKEFIEFGESRWLRKFHASGLECIQRVRLPFYLGTSTKFLPVTRFGNVLNLSSSTAYILQKRVGSCRPHEG